MENTEKATKQIETKMQNVGMKGLSACIRKMALNGLCVYLDLEEVHQLTTLISRMSANLNQYVRRTNETGSIYKEDINGLKTSMDGIWSLHKELLSQLAKIP